VRMVMGCTRAMGVRVFARVLMGVWVRVSVRIVVPIPMAVPVIMSVAVFISVAVIPVMLVVMGEVPRIAGPMMVPMPFAECLTDQEKRAEGHQDTAGDPGKDARGPAARLDAEPDQQCAEDGGENGVAEAGRAGDRERPGAAPAATACRQHEWQPMGRQCGMEERDGHACREDRPE